MESWTDMTGKEETGNCLQIIGTEVENEPKITAKWCTQCQLNLRDESGQEKSGDVETGYQEALFTYSFSFLFGFDLHPAQKKNGEEGLASKCIRWLYENLISEVVITSATYL